MTKFDYFLHKFYLKTFKFTKKLLLFIFLTEIKSFELKKAKSIVLK